ncbi:MAG: NifB/NifX family molybdenum-iron cluster-binding protein [Bacteroidales bacterium]|nr:NifB/NifX family molybdenum-iron cluster-binding protein [Bacteroidales bacterium]
MKKIAIPVANGNLCAHFGHCENFAIYEVEGGKIGNGTLLTPPPHQPGLYPQWLAGYGVTDVIAGGMGQRAISLFNQNNIQVCVGADMKAPEELVKDLLAGKLKSSGNYCDH